MLLRIDTSQVIFIIKKNDLILSRPIWFFHFLYDSYNPFSFAHSLPLKALVEATKRLRHKEKEAKCITFDCVELIETKNTCATANYRLK